MPQVRAVEAAVRRGTTSLVQQADSELGRTLSLPPPLAAHLHEVYGGGSWANRLFFHLAGREDARSVGTNDGRDIRERLSHVLWIGGSPHAGKTTLSRLLAGKYDLRIYNIDWHHVREHLHRPGGAPAGWHELTMDDRWVRPTPEQLAARDVASWTARSTLVVEDLLQLPADRAVVAEGPSAFPWWVAPLLRSPRQAIFLIASPDWRAAALARRYRDDPSTSIHARTTDPQRADRNIAARDHLMAERIVASCRELGLRYELVDGSRDIDESISVLEDQFAELLPKTLNV